MEINTIIEKYLFEASINKKKATYEFDLKVARSIKRCFEHLNIQYVSDLNRETLFSIILYYKNHTKKKNAGINQTIEWLYGIFYHFEIENPLGKFKKLPDDTENFKHFKHNELYQILNYLKRLDDSGNNLIYKLCVFLLLDTGLRTNELLNILVKNIDLEENSIFIETTKNGKNRYVYFSDLSKPTILKVLKLSNSPYLFINLLNGGLFSARALRYFLDKMKNELRFDKLHAHQFRKTFAMGLLKNGAGLEVIQKLLGHSDIKMTMVYLDVYDYYVANEYKIYQPKYLKI